ncbi:MAG: Arsenate-mycothiol transferase ArsC2 [Fimbriimonadaceae bacterium]|nr:Arsenate-mycothiol transferase ArsC2 [Fimbriimonadaceae bacterium]
MTTILFVCVHNAGRSQMAEAFLNRAAEERGLAARAKSAGTEGAGSLNPTVVQVMDEIGIPMIGQSPKSITAEIVSWADRTIGMGCGVEADRCPVRFLMAEDWGIDDPSGQPIETVRKIRDQVRQRVERLVEELEGSAE